MSTTTPPGTANSENDTTALRSAVLAAAEVPGRILLAPWGGVESTNGSFVVDEESARLTVAAFEEHGTDLPIDYEHQTLGGPYASPDGRAPAAGWIKRIFGEPGVGLLADIEWTEQGREMLAAKQYRYLSPVAIIRKSDRKLVGIHSAALTNKPAIVGIAPIVNRVNGPAADACRDSLGHLRSELGLAADADAEAVLIAAKERLVSLEGEARRRHVEQRLEEAARSGKLAGAQRGWAEALIARDETLFDEWLRTAPAVVTLGASLPPGEGRTADCRQAATARARAEFRTNQALAGLTTEEAYVADALRQADGART